MLVDAIFLHLSGLILVGYMAQKFIDFYMASCILAYPCSYSPCWFCYVLFLCVYPVPAHMSVYWELNSRPYILGKYSITELCHWALSFMLFIFHVPVPFCKIWLSSFSLVYELWVSLFFLQTLILLCFSCRNFRQGLKEWSAGS